MLLILYVTLLIFFFIHIKDVYSILKVVLTVMNPILYGLVIAYLLNYPYKLFHDHAFKKMGTKHKWLKRLKKILSLLLAYLIVFGIVVFLISVLIPELSSSIKELIRNIPTYERVIKETSDDIVVFVRNYTGYDLYDFDTYNKIITMFTGTDTAKFVTNILSDVVPSAFTTVLGIGTGLYNWIIGVIISIYLLSGKERLIRQFKVFLVAYTPEKFYSRIFKIGDVFNKKCGKFIVGKIIDSAIIGLMCYIGMSIFRFDYRVLISVIIGVSNMIPFFGPIIGAIPTTFLLLITNPMEALGFVVFVIVLQQFDGNILGPKILGESVGISGFWIIVSVIVGGGLFSVPGMLLGVPVFAAIYTLLEEGAERRLKKKEISANDVAPKTEEDLEEKHHKNFKETRLYELASELLNKGKSK